MSFALSATAARGGGRWWRAWAELIVCLVILSARVLAAGSAPGGKPSGEGPAEAFDRVVNYPFQGEDDLRAMHEAAWRALQGLDESGNGSEAETSRLLASFLREVVAFTAPEDLPGEQHQVVDFAASRDKALRRLREETGLPPPPGGAIVRLYAAESKMPEAIRELFAENMAGFTRGCRFVVVCQEGRSQASLHDTISHELTHAYILSSLGTGGDKLPLWFHEGVALHFADNKPQYISHTEFGERHVEFATKDYNDYRLAFRYLASTLGKKRLGQLIREAVEEGSAGEPLSRAIGAASYQTLLGRARSWHRRRQLLLSGVIAVVLGAVGALARRSVRRGRQRRVSEAAQDYQRADHEIAGRVDDVVQRLSELEAEGADGEVVAGDARLQDDIEQIALALVEEARALAKAGQRRLARSKLDQAWDVAPESSRVRAAVQRAINEMNGIHP